jgi:hypothetical protein
VNAPACIEAIDRDLEQIEAFVLDLRRASTALHDKLRAGESLDAAISKATALWLMNRLDDSVVDRLARERARETTSDEAHDRALLTALDAVQSVFVPQLLYLQRTRDAAFDQGRAAPSTEAPR